MYNSSNNKSFIGSEIIAYLSFLPYAFILIFSLKTFKKKNIINFLNIELILSLCALLLI